MNRIWADKAAVDWNEAYPIGNGKLGAMIFGKTDIERIQVNEDSLWSGGFIERTNPDARKNLGKIRELLSEERLEEAECLAERSMYGTYPHMRHYQKLGDIWIKFSEGSGEKRMLRHPQYGVMFLTHEKNPVTDYKRELDISRAIGRISYQVEKTNFQREYFASNPDDVIVYHIKADGETKLNFDTWLTRKDNRMGRGASFCDGCEVDENQVMRLYGQQGGTDGIGFELAVKIETTGGKQYRMGSHLIVEDADEAVFYITARTTFRSENPKDWCQKILEKAVVKGVEQLKQTHIKDYQKYFLTSVLQLEEEHALEELPTEKRLARIRDGQEDIGLINTYYNFSRYLLISSSRKESLPANLQGIWNEEFEPFWGSKYTININIQMNYWLAEKGGLSELHMPLLEHLKRMYPHGKEVAQKMYGARGFCCHHNTDIWGDCAPQDNNIAATIWPLGAAWLCLHLIQHYEYTKNEVFLEEFYPVLCDCVLFFVDYMVQDEDGYWITGPSSSPENTYRNGKGEFGNLCMGPTIDTEILRELFEGYLAIEAHVKKNDCLKQEIEMRFEGLRPLRIGENGQIQEWNRDYEEMDIGHRHISQLFALYPGKQIIPGKTPDLAKAAEVTLQRRLEHGGGHTGWSKAWIVLFFARLHKAEKAWQNMKELLGNATLNNLFDNHPPFQIDGNFGGACGLNEMLIQDYGDTIYLLPALPEELKNGSLSGVRTRSGAILDFSWKDGKIIECVIRAERDCSVAIIDENRILQQIEVKKGNKGRVK